MVHGAVVKQHAAVQPQHALTGKPSPGPLPGARSKQLSAEDGPTQSPWPATRKVERDLLQAQQALRLVETAAAQTML